MKVWAMPVGQEVMATTAFAALAAGTAAGPAPNALSSTARASASTASSAGLDAEAAAQLDRDGVPQSARRLAQGLGGEDGLGAEIARRDHGQHVRHGASSWADRVRP
jgi:hypothetical protein